MKARHDWSPEARDQFFGPEPTSDDPLPAHSEAVACCRSVLREAHRGSVRALRSHETTAYLLDFVEAAAIADTTTAGRPMRVVLMGRTMAGKSTLLAALTGGSAERIGVGAQRTSRDVFAAPALDLQEVEIVDTPGVGAKDGAEDVALAMAEVPGADLVLWVASNDSFQEETAQALRAVAFRGKPVVVALNCRARLFDELDREDFLDDPASVFDQHQGHFETIRAHLSAAGVQPLAEVMLHAEAARQARTDEEFGSGLKSASRIQHLLGTLEQESRVHRIARRVLRATDEVRVQAQMLSEVLADSEQQIRDLVRVARGLRKDQQLRAARLVDACQQRVEDDTVRMIGQRHGWHQTIADFGPQVAGKWEEEQDSLIAELDQALTSHLNELSRAIAEANSAAEQEWSTATLAAPRIEGLRDFRGLWKRRAAGAVVGAGGALAAALLGAKVGALAGGAFGGPIGAGVGLIVGGVGTALVSPLRKKVQSLFKGKGRILEENRELLRVEIGNVLEEMERQARTQTDTIIGRIRADLSSTAEQRAEAEVAVLDVAELLAGQQKLISAATAALDHDTAVCLLQVDGRPRLAASVERVTRLAGVCIAVEVTEQSFAESWLFPPSSPEVMTFGRPPSPEIPGARAASYVLGLTEQVPKVLRAHTDRTSVTIDALVPEPVLAAWSATLSDHLGTQITIARPNSLGVPRNE
ncbi:GTPase domain-containing protein [Tessaracoccus sp. MC1679]|uniref:GTPase domain-containing protein n=1 Tax=Tessaracoccus sp. MC1679 TaxID=2760313 RepID=UPI00160071D1|nr:GTPase domain-containing protein [Tessaracoccus sp. MC1679]MBB1515753.1 GTPase domain-containing protein [Tessaracoccus sp. MC1679]